MDTSKERLSNGEQKKGESTLNQDYQDILKLLLKDKQHYKVTSVTLPGQETPTSIGICTEEYYESPGDVSSNTYISDTSKLHIFICPGYKGDLKKLMHQDVAIPTDCAVKIEISNPSVYSNPYSEIITRNHVQVDVIGKMIVAQTNVGSDYFSIVEVQGKENKKLVKHLKELLTQ